MRYPSSEGFGEGSASLADQAWLGVAGGDVCAEACETQRQAAIATSDLEYFRAAIESVEPSEDANMGDAP